MTFLGLLVGLIFIGAYVGLMLATRIEGAKGKALGWGCWLVAIVLILVCHAMTPDAG